MLNSMIIFVVVILFFVFFIIHKRDMLIKMFSLNASMPAGEFQAQLERTADAAVKRLETQIAHLELLLEEVDAKINQLDETIKAADVAAMSRESPRGASPVPQFPSAGGGIDFPLPAELPEPAAAVASEPALPAEHSSRPLGPESPNSDKRRLILNMAEEGYSVIEIAKTTGMGKGEIMLILQLNKK